MSKLHHKIVREIVEKYRKDPSVLGIRLLGSVGRREERSNSDVDIEIIQRKGKKWKWQKKQKYGIHIDFVTSSKEYLLYQFKNYPYLSFIDLDKKILYDPTSFLKRIRKNIQIYMRQHPEVISYWNKHFKDMKKQKTEAHKPQNLIRLFDQAEFLFSKRHNITRTWFRK